MKRLFLAAVLALIPTLATAGDASLVLHTEAYPPYSYMQGGTLEGGNVKVIKELFKRAHIPVVLQLDSWDKGYEAARKQEGHGVFAAVRTQDRENLFRWVGPISSVRWVLMAKKGRNIKLAELEKAFAYKIGGVKNDAKTLFLEKAGGKVDAIDSDAANAKRLEAGEIDLWVTGYLSGAWYAKQEGISDLEEVLAFREDSGYLALNKATNNATVLSLTRILEQMKDQGLLNPMSQFK